MTYAFAPELAPLGREDPDCDFALRGMRAMEAEALARMPVCQPPVSPGAT